jgi:hypothetical protein
MLKPSPRLTCFYGLLVTTVSRLEKTSKRKAGLAPSDALSVIKQHKPPINFSSYVSSQKKFGKWQLACKQLFPFLKIFPPSSLIDPPSSCSAKRSKVFPQDSSRHSQDSSFGDYGWREITGFSEKKKGGPPK